MHKIINELIDSAFLLPQTTKSGTELSITGIRGWTSEFKEFYANRVGFINYKNPKEKVKEVIDYFRTQKKGFSWALSQKEIEEGYIELLVSLGFRRQVPGPIAGMCLNAPFAINELPSSESFYIRKIEPQQVLENIELYARSAEIPKEIVRHIFYPDKGATIPSIHYLAFDKISEKPVGYAIYVPLNGGSIALMKGGGILPEYRRKGIYFAMLQQRILDAKQNNVESIIIHANRTHAYHACKKLGFEMLCQMEWLSWNPETKTINS